MNDHTSASHTAKILGKAVAIVSFLLALSCSSAEVASFKWKNSSGESQAFAQTADFPKGQENLLSQGRPKNSFALRKTLVLEPGFMIAARVNVKRDGLGLGFSLSSDAKKPGREVRFAAKPGNTTFYLSPPDSRSVKIFAIGIFPLKGSMNAEDETSLVELESVSILPAFLGFEHTKEDGYRISDGISLESPDSGVALWTFASPFAASLESAKAAIGASKASLAGALLIRYASNSDADITISAAGKKILAKCASAGKEIFLPASVFPDASSLERITVSVPGSVNLEAAYIEAVPAAKVTAVDPGVVLLEPPLSAAEDFAWYRWDLLPSVIMFDFRNYAVQDAYLKRLAFFVEKKGFAGKLAKDEEISSLHGWNAHDYKTDDLARFFTTAEKTGFQLSVEERKLRDFLIEKKLLEKSGKEFLGLDGAIISISQESPAYLRHTFLTHESSHAIFFADKRYREFCISLWNSMSKDEKWFWFLYFGWMNYDTSSAYLMANEMQAYLIQQPLKKAEEYFSVTLVKRLLENHPELKAPLAEYMGKYGAEFSNKAGELDKWLKAAFGFGAGTTFFLR